MAWWMKATLCILSGFLLFSCGEKKQKKDVPLKETKTDKIDQFFETIKHWDKDSVKSINEIGMEISEMDSTLTFLPFSNDYEPNAFIFNSQSQENFKDFENNELLSHGGKSFSEYKVWRKEINNQKLLDISIEPHPTLKWIFVVRLRGQE